MKKLQVGYGSALVFTFLFLSLSLQRPCMVDKGILPFLNEHRTNSRLYTREKGEDHRHGNPHPIVYSAFPVIDSLTADTFLFHLIKL